MWCVVCGAWCVSCVAPCASHCVPPRPPQTPPPPPSPHSFFSAERADEILDEMNLPQPEQLVGADVSVELLRVAAGASEVGPGGGGELGEARLVVPSAGPVRSPPPFPQVPYHSPPAPLSFPPAHVARASFLRALVPCSTTSFPCCRPPPHPPRNRLLPLPPRHLTPSHTSQDAAALLSRHKKAKLKIKRLAVDAEEGQPAGGGGRVHKWALVIFTYAPDRAAAKAMKRLQVHAGDLVRIEKECDGPGGVWLLVRKLDAGGDHGDGAGKCGLVPASYVERLGSKTKIKPFGADRA